MYAPLEDAIASVKDYVTPGMYRAKMFASQDEVDDSFDGVGTRFKVSVNLSEMDGSETSAKCYENFIVPNEESDVEKLLNRQKKDGGTYPDQAYTKFKTLQGVLKAPISSKDSVLEMFAAAKVAWMVNLEISAASKDRQKNPVQNWAQIDEWFSAQHAAKASEREGTSYWRLVLYNNSPENLATVEEATAITGVRFRNTLSGYKKPVKLA